MFIALRAARTLAARFFWAMTKEEDTFQMSPRRDCQSTENNLHCKRGVAVLPSPAKDFPSEWDIHLQIIPVKLKIEK